MRKRTCPYLLPAVLAALVMLLISASECSAAPAPRCNIRTSPGAMSFTIDPSAPGPINAVVATQPEIRCTAGLAFTVASQSSNAGGPFGGPPTFGALSDGAGHQIVYTITHLAGGTGLGLGGAGNISMNIGGTVNRIDYENAFLCEGACSYTDIVTLQVTY